MTEEAPHAMTWEPGAESTLRALVDMVPATMKELARATARDESELAAQERGGDSVGAIDVVRGWIRTTPPEQRDGLIEVIDALGFEAAEFEAALRSTEGWGDDAEED